METDRPESQLLLEMKSFWKMIRNLVKIKNNERIKFIQSPITNKYPCDDLITGSQDQLDVYKFISKLLIPYSNSSQLSGITLGGPIHASQPDLVNYNQVLDDTEGFNFITCHTSDTLWTTASLFWKPLEFRFWIGNWNWSNAVSLTLLVWPGLRGFWKSAVNAVRSYATKSLVRRILMDSPPDKAEISYMNRSIKSQLLLFLIFHALSIICFTAELFFIKVADRWNHWIFRVRNTKAIWTLGKISNIEISN